MYGQRQPHSAGASMGGVSSAGRVPELLEALRAEYENLQQECAFLKHHREDFDTKNGKY